MLSDLLNESLNDRDVPLHEGGSEVTDTIWRQVTKMAPSWEKYLRKATGLSFRLFKMATVEGPNVLNAKFVGSKRATGFSGLMVALKIAYSSGSDLYNVTIQVFDADMKNVGNDEVTGASIDMLASPEHMLGGAAMRKGMETLKGQRQQPNALAAEGLDQRVDALLSGEVTESSMTYEGLKAAAKKAGAAWVSALKKIKPTPKSVTLVKSEQSSIAGWDYKLYSLATIVMSDGTPVNIGISVSVKEGEEASGSVAADAPYGVVATARGRTYDEVSKRLATDTVEHLTRSAKNTGKTESKMYKVGQKVKVPAGTEVGMGKLRDDVVGEIDAERTDEWGSQIYGVSWTDPKSKKSRHTWLHINDIVTESRLQSESKAEDTMEEVRRILEGKGSKKKVDDEEESDEEEDPDETDDEEASEEDEEEMDEHVRDFTRLLSPKTRELLMAGELPRDHFEHVVEIARRVFVPTLDDQTGMVEDVVESILSEDSFDPERYKRKQAASKALGNIEKRQTAVKVAPKSEPKKKITVASVGNAIKRGFKMVFGRWVKEDRKE